MPDDSILYVEFRANYMDTRYVGIRENYPQFVVNELLGRDSLPPYEWIWDLKSVQDQHYNQGMIGLWAHTAKGAIHATNRREFVIDRTPFINMDKAVFSKYSKRPYRYLAKAHKDMFRNGYNTIRFASAWNWDSLFMHIIVEDNSVIVHTEDSEYWLGDDVEVFLDVYDTKSSLFEQGIYQLIISAEGNGYISNMYEMKDSNYPVQTQPLTVRTVKKDTAGYEITWSAAWETFGIKPKKGMHIGFDICNWDLDYKNGFVTMVTWMGLHHGNHHNASEWGELILQKDSTGIKTASILAVIAAAVIPMLLVQLRMKKKARLAARHAVDKNKTQANLNYLTSEIIKIVEHESDNDELCMKYIANKMNRTPRYLSSLFRHDTGVHFADYLNTYRLRKADELLNNTNKTCAVIATEVGYREYSYFSKLFKKMYGLNPIEARKTHRPS